MLTGKKSSVNLLNYNTHARSSTLHGGALIGILTDVLLQAYKNVYSCFRSCRDGPDAGAVQSVFTLYFD
jgi:hypothetical protein